MSDDQLHFDPRRWVKPEPEPEIVTPVPRPPDGMSRRVWIGGAVGLCAGGGGLAAWTLRGRPAPVAAPAKTADIAPIGGATARAPSSDVAEHRTTIAGPGELRALLVAQGIRAQDAEAIAGVATPHLAGAAGDIVVTLALRLAGDVRLVRMRAERADSSGVEVTSDGARWRATALARSVSTRLVSGGGEIGPDGLYAAAVGSHLNESLLPDFAKAFAFDFDFQTDLRQGDTFEMSAAQPTNAAGQPVGPPRLVFASLTTTAKSKILYRFTGADGQDGWYDASGRSVKRSFMRTPVDGARITSTFGPRVHPIFHDVKFHKGIDFGVPIGTPIYAAADGLVQTAHFSESGGNMVVLVHEKPYKTRYLHMSKFADGVVAGAHVRQGQVVGLSGTTGHSTGPHLHFELLKNEDAVDPLAAQSGSATTALTGAGLAAFGRERARIDAARARQSA